MKATRRRGLIAKIGTGVAAAALVISGGVAAQAALPVPDSSTVDITKCEQPADPGTPADGLEKPASTCTGIDGVVYTARLVPGTAKGEANDIGTNEGQKWASEQTVATAQAVAGYPAASTPFPITTSGGKTSLVLPRGLYVIEETAVPDGVTAGAPFLLSVPLTDPSDLSKWLDTIYVYPKNARIGEPTKSVDNATDYVVGDKVTWTVNGAIPRVPNSATPPTPKFLPSDGYEIRDTLDDTELSTTVAEVNVTVPAGLVKGAGAFDDASAADYFVVLDDSVAGKTTVRIQFTAAGRAKLATAVNADPDAQVTVTLDTQVLKSGEIKNQALVFPNAEAITDNKGVPSNEEVIKYGKFNVQKASTGTGTPSLSGAEFKVYASESDAKAMNANNLKPLSNPSGVWTTDADGRFTVDGLRDTDWANGEATTSADGDPLYKTYYLVETKALAGHQLLSEPIAITVNQTTGQVTPSWAADLTVTNVLNSGGFTLPLTGGTGTLFLTVGGVVLLGLVLAVVIRRRKNSEV